MKERTATGGLDEPWHTRGTRNVHSLRDVLCLGCSSRGETAGDPAAAAAFRREAIHRPRVGCASFGFFSQRVCVIRETPAQPFPKKPSIGPQMTTPAGVCSPGRAPRSPARGRGAVSTLAHHRPRWLFSNFSTCELKPPTQRRRVAAGSNIPRLSVTRTVWRARSPWSRGNSRFCACNPFRPRRRNQCARTGAPRSTPWIPAAWPRFQK